MKKMIPFVATILIATPAFAATLHSPSALIAVGNRIDCVLRNVGNKDLNDVSVDSRAGPGSNGIASPSLAAGDTLTTGTTNAGGSAALGWCKFEFKGGRKAVRASLCIRPSVSASCAAIVEVD